MKDVDEVIDGYSGRAYTVLLYTQMVKRLADAAKRPGFTADDWAPLAALVDTGEFERVGNFKEVMNWTQYLEFLSNWAPSSSWEASFKRVSEVDGVVFLELEERSEVGEFTSVVNSLSVYEFADDGKISHIDLYLQMALPNMEMLDSYQGVEISE
ncbi:MAG: hypothetical protein WA942_03945 [Mycolicibacter sinensis]